MTVADGVLGDTKGVFSCNTRVENQQALVRLAAQVRGTVALYSRLLGPELYGSSAFVAQIRRFILDNRFARFRIVVVEPSTIVSKGHRLINLATSMSSFIHLRRAPKRYRIIDEEYIVLDETAYLYRDSAARFKARVAFHDRYYCRALLERFDALWEESLPDNNLRRLI